ncbi:MAG: cytidylate kinase family protein [Candidatus Micrarchaeaceae archaeon]
MKAIVISGCPAAGKTTVAKLLGEKLNIEVIGGGEILKEMAQERGYSPTGSDWWDTSDGIRFLKERERNSEFDKEVDKKMEKRIRDGNIVVTSYTAPWLFKEGFKVWLDASVEERTERMSKRDGTEPKQTEEIVKFREKENHKLYMSLYKIDFGQDKTPFDLVIDTNNKKPEEILDLILKKYK